MLANINNNEEQLQAIVQTAIAHRTPLRIISSDSKAFYGHHVTGTPVSLATHTGILSYEPSELVITARAGTTLRELTAELAIHKQQLGFEPPYFGEQATLGGTIACGFSGPARPYIGAARDFVLGIKCLTGKGEILSFGGQVMKNVAGYDVSRFLVGSLGTLAILLEISCKVIPLPEEEITLVMATDVHQALKFMAQWGQPPITATCFDGEHLYMRLAGTAIQETRRQISAEELVDGQQFWLQLKEQQLAFFTQENTPLWRLSVPPTTPHLSQLTGNTLIEWGGAQRWLRTDLSADYIRNVVNQVGGHATLFKSNEQQQTIFHPLPIPLMQLQQRLQQQFDPYTILNRGKMWPLSSMVVS